MQACRGVGAVQMAKEGQTTTANRVGQKCLLCTRAYLMVTNSDLNPIYYN